jgi:hypothetical protein
MVVKRARKQGTLRIVLLLRGRKTLKGETHERLVLKNGPEDWGGANR